MTISRSETDRIAAAIHALRPDWPVKSLCTFIDGNLADRSYADVTVALATVAVDPKTQTPRRVLESGPWWQAVQVAFAVHGSHATQTPGPQQPRCPKHPHELVHNCRDCITDQYDPTDAPTLTISPDQAAVNARGAALVLERLKRPTDPEPYTDRQMAAAGDVDA